MNQKLLGNSFATKTINPNPFVVLQYVGDSFIGPSVDSWYDISTEPLVTDNNTNLYSIFLAKNNIRESLSQAAVPAHGAGGYIIIQIIIIIIINI